MPDHKVLAIVTQEECDEMLELDIQKKSALEMLEKINEQISKANINQKKWFRKIGEKYGIPDGVFYLNYCSREIREGIAESP